MHLQERESDLTHVLNKSGILITKHHCCLFFVCSILDQTPSLPGKFGNLVLFLEQSLSLKLLGIPNQ